MPSLICILFRYTKTLLLELSRLQLLYLQKEKGAQAQRIQHKVYVYLKLCQADTKRPNVYVEIE
jgi:hypothetical protein